MILVLDTETAGIGPTARIIQIAADLCREDGTSVATLNTLVAAGVSSHPKALEVHGITDEMAVTGLDPMVAGSVINAFIDQATLVIGHNINFDIDMCKQSFVNFKVPWSNYCTLKTARAKLGLASNKLGVVYRHFFDEDFADAHSAMADVQACKRVYLRMKEMGL
jgi:DNA polymerase III epsilon subunit-like protein